MIKNRPPQLRERGKIKIGKKGDSRQKQGGGGTYQMPVKLDHFLITTMEIGADGNFVPDLELMEIVANSPEQDADALKRIPVRLLFNSIELNWASSYAAYEGKTVWCRGDGESAQRLEKGDHTEVVCPCPNLDRGYKGPRKCKINGMLSLLIDGALGVGGVWKFRTTGFNSHDALFGSLMFINGVTGGQLAGVPLDLVVGPKKVADPDEKQQTIYVVGLEFNGSLDELRTAALQIARQNWRSNLQIENAELEARKLFEADQNTVFPDEDAVDVADEFYPDEQETPAPPVADPTAAPEPEPEPAEETPPPPKPPGKPRAAAPPAPPAAPAAPKEDLF